MPVTFTPHSLKTTRRQFYQLKQKHSTAKFIALCLQYDVAGGNKIYYYHYDGLGSVVALSDVNSEVVELYEYDVFGRVTIWDMSTLDIVGQSTVGNPYMFTGRRHDGETGLYYYRFRYYDPYTGRFLQTDPIGYATGLNLYAYVGNNPIYWVDPWGLIPFFDKSRPRDNFWGPVWDMGNATRDLYHAGMAFGYGAAGFGLKGAAEFGRQVPPSEPMFPQYPHPFTFAYDLASGITGFMSEEFDDWGDKALEKMKDHAKKSHGLTPVPMTGEEEQPEEEPEEKTDKPKEETAT